MAARKQAHTIDILIESTACSHQSGVSELLRRKRPQRKGDRLVNCHGLLGKKVMDPASQTIGSGCAGIELLIGFERCT